MMDNTLNSQKAVANAVMAKMEKQFINMYRKLPFLWNPNHPDYNNRYKRNEGYDILLPIFKQYMPNATRFHIRQKINILRSCYRKELRKHLASRKTDSDGKVQYTHTPSSWKFQMLRFLDEDEDRDNSSDANNDAENYADYEEEQELEFVQDLDTESGNDEPDTSKINISPLYVEDDNIEHQMKKRRWDSSNSYSEEEVLAREFNAIGANVSCKLQRMNSQQRYHAELLINKVLIHGLNNRLTDDTELTDTWHVDEVSMNYPIINKTEKVESMESKHKGI